MSEDILREVACPNCQNPIDLRQHGRHVQCDACRSQFLLEGHLCPYCATYHRAEAGFCSQCGTPLTRLCRKCRKVNWAGNEYCLQCGTPLDIFELLHLHTNQATVDRLQQQMASAQQIKTQEEEASRRRMAEFMAMEEERQRELQGRLQKQNAQERMLLLISVGGVAAFFLFILLYVAFLSLQ